MHNTYFSPAKLNLFLHITSKRDDGYHNLQTIFVLLNYFDKLTFDVNNSGLIHRISGNNNIAVAEDIIIIAAKILQKYSPNKLGVNIKINKKIPLGAGLGGGSSNCATTLLALNKLWAINLELDKLADLGRELGADVPVFIYQNNAWASSIGDKLTPIIMPKYYFLVIYPQININTKVVFSHKKLNYTKKITKITKINNLNIDLKDKHNDCLDVATIIYPEVLEVINWLDNNTHNLQNNIAKARMSGTGSSVFIYTKDKEQLTAIAQKCPKKWQVFITSNIN